jgi:nucleotide-binding universal stress UspA family protein
MSASPTDPVRKPKIVLATRLSRDHDPTAAEATKLARALSGELVLVYVAVELGTLPMIDATSGDDPGGTRHKMLQAIDREVRTYLDRNVAPVHARIRIEQGDVARCILRVLEEEDPDYVVIGTEGGTSLRELVVGSTSRDILRGSRWPVLVVPRRRR